MLQRNLNTCLKLTNFQNNLFFFENHNNQITFYISSEVKSEYNYKIIKPS